MVVGYRSPMRPVPPEAFPDSSSYLNTGELNTSREFLLPYGEESPMDSRRKDEWWHEAMAVADKAENMPRMLDLEKEVGVLALDIN